MGEMNGPGTDQASLNQMVGRRVLVTGASGFIGTHLTRRLVAAGASVIALDLKIQRETLPDVSYMIGDVRNLESVNLPKVDEIFNLAAVHTTPGHQDHEYYDTNVNGALEVVRLAERDNVLNVTFTSSISVYGPSEDRMTEASQPAPVSAYGKSKLMAEKIQRAWADQDERRSLVVARPAVVFGAGEGGNFARMAGLLKKGVFVFPGRRDTVKSCIYVEDLLDLMLIARGKAERLITLNGSYPECPTLERIVTVLQERYFPRARLIDVPHGVVMAAAQGLSTLNGVGLGFHPDRVTKLVRSTHVFPGWAVENNLLTEGGFSHGVDRWAEATGRTFV